MTKEKMEHTLVPVHEKLSESDKKEILTKYNVTPLEMPKIRADDPAIRHLDTKRGDMIRITRKSPTAGTTYFYRVVINV
jgi:DNA-directed RNA polymerase subunit H